MNVEGPGSLLEYGPRGLFVLEGFPRKGLAALPEGSGGLRILKCWTGDGLLGLLDNDLGVIFDKLDFSKPSVLLEGDSEALFPFSRLAGLAETCLAVALLEACLEATLLD